ncbi:hexosaminidase D-like [Periplaneta americana]|uniref:hexosaminidase D-like n=1 Tax=Periplaneta americana TaxID=6978 RepID=UPI0037E979A1
MRRRALLLCVLAAASLAAGLLLLLGGERPVPAPAPAPAPVSAPTPTAAEERLRVVHLDLKGAPPRMRYLRALLPLLAAAGANALLVEYEDMFPWDGALRNASATNAWSRAQVTSLQALATRHGLELIPLVQTFGHLEFALKLPEFARFRELPAFPQELCPSNPDAWQLLARELVRQVLALHPRARWLHIGCDEVFHLAACGRCSRRRLEPRQLFVEHVTRVAGYVRAEFPGVTPLVWDDMLRHWSPLDLADSGLGGLVEPVVWVYAPDIARLLPHYVWHAYTRVFPRVWIASAFKGAFGETALAPDVRRHAENNAAWMRVLRGGAAVRGVVLTGWARYDHFAVLCELLPVAVPSLVLDLLLVSREAPHVDEDVLRLWTRLLACPPDAPPIHALDADPFQWRLAACAFPGSDAFALAGRLATLRARVNALHEELTEQRAWLTPYNVRHNFSSPWRVLESHSTQQRLVRELVDLRNATMRVLGQYFDRYTTQEWLEQRVDPLEDKLGRLQSASARLLAWDTWPRRPLSAAEPP